MALITVPNLVPRVRRWLEDTPWSDTISANITTTGATTMSLTTPSLWAVGDVAEFQPDGEQVLLVSPDPPSNPVTIRRGWADTTAAIHTSGDVVLKNPRFDYYNTLEAITRLIDNGLNWPYAWKAVTASVTPDNTKIWYDLNATAVGLIAVFQLSAAPVDRMSYGRRGSKYPVRFDTGLPTSLVASGVGVSFPSGLYHPTNTLYVTYAAPLTTGDITDGLMSDCVVWGACERLLSMKEVPRTGTDASMGDASVQPGAEQRAAGYFHAKFVQARKELKTYLRATIPVIGHA